MSPLRHILATLALFGLLLPTLPLPSGAAALFCTPSGQPVSPAMEAAYRDLMAAIGETPEAGGGEHCEDCVTGVATLGSRTDTRLATYAVGSLALTTRTLSHPRARGPPLGSRAPPLFV